MGGRVWPVSEKIHENDFRRNERALADFDKVVVDF